MKFQVNPLKRIQLRTYGLSSVEAAKFGMTRNGGKRAHQGIDLATDEGFKVYAVENGTIVSTAFGSNGYGYTVTLKVDNSKNKQLYKLFIFYAHLDRIDVRVGQIVKAGDILGLSGDTGNAKGMTTIERGGHLHLEVRTKQVLGLGLEGRIDPLPFLNL